MPSKRKKIMALLLKEVSQGEIAVSLSCSKSTVSETVRVMRKEPITEEVLAKLTDEEVRRTFFPRKKRTASTFIEPDWEHMASELSRPGVTRNLLWAEYLKTTTLDELKHYSYTAFCKKLEVHLRQTKATYKVVHVPGKLMYCDWAGDTMAIKSSLTGQDIKAYIFVACLPYSDILYARAFPNLKQENWIAGHIASFEYSGGVPALLVPDRCATAVDRTPIYATVLNETYEGLAAHHGTAVLPARSGKPKDKALVEGGVNIVETWVMARLRNEVFFSFDELNEAILDAVDDINEKPFQVREGSRFSQFQDEEKELLRPLPAKRYEFSVWKRAKASPDYRIQVDYMRYSVPARYIGCSLDVRVSDSNIAIFDSGACIVAHARLYGRKGQYSTVESHMPEAHKRFSGVWTPSCFRQWARSVGDERAIVIDKVLESKPIIEQAFVPCSNILGLSKRGERELLEKACVQIDELGGLPSYTRARQIMAALRTSDQPISAPTRTAEDRLGKAGRTRGAKHYARKEG